MMSGKRKTKIVCTIGPAVQSREMLRRLVDAGMNVARLNFSHGDYSLFSQAITDLRAIEQEVGHPVAIMADIQGPKIRTGKFENSGVELVDGTDVYITTDSVMGGVRDGKVIIPVDYKDFVRDVGPGCTVLLDDGLMGLRVLERASEGLTAKVIDGGFLKNHKGINVPEATFSARSITEKDYGDILFAIEKDVDYIALSFVRTAQEVRHLKSFIESRDKKIQVISKIEMPAALTHLDEIIDASDGILVARGDLAVEVGNERVPLLQKKIVRKSNLRGKFVIIATQMLMSMIDNPRPSRAEAADVANAVLDGADSLMLSNETTIGKYPLETVEMMAKIIMEIESEVVQPILYNEWQLPPAGQLAVAILQSAVRMSAVVAAKSLVVVTQSGRSATLVSKCRPKMPVFAITGSMTTYRQLAVNWGVQAIFMEDMENLITQTAVFEAIGQRLLALNLCGTGDRIVITAGLPRLAHGSTNTIKVHQI